MHRKHSKPLPLPPLFRHIKSLQSLKQLHAHLLTNSILSHSNLRHLIFVASISIPSALPYALKLFEKTPHPPDPHIFHTLIRAASHSPTPLHSLKLLSLMPQFSLIPTPETFPFLFRTCTKIVNPVLGSQLLAISIKLYSLDNYPHARNSVINMFATCGYLPSAERLFSLSARSDPAAWSTIISGFARRGELDYARKLFDDEKCVKDLVSWNVMISGYVRAGDMRRAGELFEVVPERDVVTWNAMIAGYVRCGGFRAAMEVFERMYGEGVRADDVTMLSLVSACADKGDLDVGRKVHGLVSGMCGGREMRTVLGNAIIDMYAKCGRMDFAVEVFRGMRDKDLSSWNTVVGGLACNGQCEESVRLFEEMLARKVRPDEITFVSVLVACNHGGMVELGRRYFEMMRREYGIEPNLKHYGCMVDMLGRAGHLEDAFDFVVQMKIKPNSVIWRALLGSCKTHGNVRLAERANEELLKLKNNSSGDYVLLSNLYALKGEWAGAEKVRKLMDDSGVHKAAGGALIGTDEK